MNEKVLKRLPAPDDEMRAAGLPGRMFPAVGNHEVWDDSDVDEVDGVKYLVLGGGGAEQDPILPGRTHVKVPADYPPDQYWKGERPREEYNYVLVDVQPGQKTKFTLNRFRPQSAEPFGSVELFASGR